MKSNNHDVRLSKIERDLDFLNGKRFYSRSLYLHSTFDLITLCGLPCLESSEEFFLQLLEFYNISNITRDIRWRSTKLRSGQEDKFGFKPKV